MSPLDFHLEARQFAVIGTANKQTQRTLLDWLRVEYAIKKPGNKLLAVAERDSDAWLAGVNRIRGKKLPLTAAGFRDRTFGTQHSALSLSPTPARARAAEALTLEHTLNDLVNPAYGLNPAQIDLMRKTAPLHRTPQLIANGWLRR